jgi:formate dehydrogenase major subunit
VCPTGALFEKDNPYVGQDADSNSTHSICLQCSVGCGIEVKTRGNHLVRILGDWGSPVTGGVICKAGRVLPMQEKRERLTTPLLRRDGQLQPAIWEEALAFVAERLRPLRNQNGHGIAALASTRLSVEALSLFRQLFKTGLTTSIEEGVPTAAPAAQAQQTGQAFESDLRALHGADCVVLVGANPLASHEVISFFIKRHLPNGLRLIVIDPQATDLSDRALVHLTPAKGQDAALLAELGAALAQPEAARPEIQAAVEVLRGAQQVAFVYGKGITRQRAALTALLDVVKALRQSGPQAHLLSLKGEANSLAAAQLGLDQPFALNGQQAIYLALGDDQPSESLLKRLEKAPFLVVQAAYRSPLTDRADVVLPVEMWAETEGHYLNLDGRLQKAQPALQSPSQVRSNAAVFLDLAQAWSQPLDDDWRGRLMERVACVPLVM